MRSATYPFVSFKRGDPPRPYVPILVSNPQTGNELEVFALIDTGADECAFPASFADYLGHTLTSGTEKHIQTGNGVTLAYGHTSVISIDTFKTEPTVVDYLVNPDTPLLGMRSFLSSFVVTLDYPQQTVTLQYEPRA
jgi:predicted aspartyl protease